MHIFVVFQSLFCVQMLACGTHQELLCKSAVKSLSSTILIRLQACNLSDSCVSHLVSSSLTFCSVVSEDGLNQAAHLTGSWVPPPYTHTMINGQGVKLLDAKHMLFCPLVQIYNKLIKVINALISTALIYVCTYTMFQILIFFFFL